MRIIFVLFLAKRILTQLLKTIALKVFNIAILNYVFLFVCRTTLRYVETKRGFFYEFANFDSTIRRREREARIAMSLCNSEIY